MIGMSELGFGLMRLPLKSESDQASIDIEQVKDMVDMYMDAGLNYFDTAYMYHANASERAIKEALVDRYPRESYRIATKLPIMMLSSPEQAEQVFEEQLSKIGVDYFDNYLIHNICSSFLPNLESCKAFDLVKRKKAEGKIRRIGFSFHDGPELLEKVLSEHPEMEFVQLQVNYLDMDNASIASRKNLEIAKAHGIPVIVMEPVKGGILAKVPGEVRELFASVDPMFSPAAWALRFVMGLEVETVLSGMSTREQMAENLRAVKDFRGFGPRELEAIERAKAIINSKIAIPCTACRYCMKSCPQDILIADYFELYNAEKANPSVGWSVPGMYYGNKSKSHGKASDCVECGNCEEQCPQHLKVIDLLKDVAALFEKSRAHTSGAQPRYFFFRNGSVFNRAR